MISVILSTADIRYLHLQYSFRLILSHLGFLSIPALRAAVDSPVPRLVALETDSPAFPADLESLDRLSPRTYDTLLAYYVRAGQSAAQDILANSRAGDLSPLYLECLAALGKYRTGSTHELGMDCLKS